jgi:hypothetical protein
VATNLAKPQHVAALASLASYDGAAGIFVDTNVWFDCIDEGSPGHNWAMEQLRACSERYVPKRTSKIANCLKTRHMYKVEYKAIR